MSLVAAAVAQRAAALALLVALGPDAFAPPQPAPAGPPRAVTRSFAVMGTEARFTIWTSNVVGANRAFEDARAEIQRVERLMTDWDRPAWGPSDVVRVNAGAGKTAVKVSDETLAVVEESLEMSRQSEGAFDITFAAMKGLWKFDEDLEPKVPPPEEIERRRKLINWRDVIVNKKAHTIKLRREGMRIGLGGIAKGYAVDRCAGVLRAAGFNDFMVQAGGDLFVSGQKGEANWMVGVRDPRGGPAAIIARMPIKDHAFSTAGDYERSFVLDGRRYHHIIDPKTGYPATASREVTIFAPTAFLADALDDAVFILGPQKGMALVEKFPGCAALIVDAKNQVWTSKSLEGKLQRTAAPTDGI
jgi:thiamine biosynthesis lipoprotein